MSRFWCDMTPSELAAVVEPLFSRTPPIGLTFSQPAQLGPKKVDVHLLEPSEPLKILHHSLHRLLDSINVTYEYPQFVDEGHKPHVSGRDDDNLTPGYKQMTTAAYLIEVEIQGEDHLRFVRAKFDLNG